MIGDQIKALREGRSWTQGHLADASGVSLRTIQRLEKLHSCSPDTLLALASALDVDVRQLTSHRAIGPPSVRQWPAWHWLTPQSAALTGAILVLPAALFVAANYLKYGLGLAAPYDALADVGGRLGLIGWFYSISPPIIVGGALLALLINLAAQVQAHIDRGEGGLTVTGITVKARAPGVIVVLAALASLAAISAYLVGETMTHIARAVAGL